MPVNVCLGVHVMQGQDVMVSAQEMVCLVEVLLVMMEVVLWQQHQETLVLWPLKVSFVVTSHAADRVRM